MNNESAYYAVCGNPILHSKSPELYNQLFHEHNINAGYSRLHSPTAADAITTMNELDLKGINVTAPFKTDIIEYLDEIDDHAKLIGAVNVIKNPNGKLKGYNTDYIAIQNIIHNNNINLKNIKCLVIGAGGAANAAVYALKLNDANVSIINRTNSNSKSLAEKYKCNFIEFSNLDQSIHDSDIIIYTVPNNTIDIPDNLFNSNKIIIDANYKNSHLSIISQKIGMKYFSGYDWLISQGLDSFNILTGIKSQTVSFDFNQSKNKSKNIILIGFMGSGKSTVGKIIAKKLNFNFIDIDREIEIAENMTISDIFASKGEPYFRELESNFLFNLNGSRGNVIATGGGIIETEKNQSALKSLGSIIWLYARFDTCIKRANTTTRPLLSGEDYYNRALKLYQSRKHKYFSSSDLIINSKSDLESVANNIIFEYQNIIQHKTIHPCIINGNISAPSSKSMSVRAIVASLFSQNIMLNNVSDCDDAQTALDIVQKFGVQFHVNNKELILTNSQTLIHPKEINCGESALCLRLFSVIAGLLNDTTTITGEGSLLTRDISDIITPLDMMGVECKTTNGYLPITVKGPIKPGNYNFDASKSSQLLSGLLLVLPLLKENSTLNVENLVSTPYIVMTISFLEALGIIIEKSDNIFKISGNQKYSLIKYHIENDWSSSSFMLCAGAISGNIQLSGLDFNSHQPDKIIIDILKIAGAEINVNDNSISVKKSNLKSFSIDLTNAPDLFPILAVLACYCNGTSYLSGVKRLFNKESNRSVAITSELSKLGANIKIIEDTMIVIGSKLKGGKVYSHNDHRIAMALAIAALGANSKVTIQDTDCVSKSYPDFWVDLKNIGGIIHE